jgi:hypothetical protein
VPRKSNQHQNHKQAISVYDLRIWGEINYLDSSTDYREYLAPQSPRACAPEELELLDDQNTFPWMVVAKSASVIAAACAILLIVSSSS